MSHVAQPDTTDTDTKLLEDIAGGDVKAFERLYYRYFRKLVGFAARITTRMDLAEEVASDTLMAVWRSAAQFEGRSKVSTWIFGIAYRQAMKARSRGQVDVLNVEVPENLPSEECGTREVERLFLRDQLARALRCLPAEQRAVVELTYYYGHGYREISEIVGCPMGTVKTRMMQARRRLKNILSPGPSDEEGERSWTA